MEGFVQQGGQTLPDRYQAMDELEGREIYALDCTYQAKMGLSLAYQGYQVEKKRIPFFNR